MENQQGRLIPECRISHNGCQEIQRQECEWKRYPSGAQPGAFVAEHSKNDDAENAKQRQLQ